MRPIKILYIIGTLDIGGSEKQLVALAEGLDRSRFLPVVFCLAATGPWVADLEKSGVDTRCFGLRGLKVWRNPILVARCLFAFLSDLKKEKPDIVQGFLFYAYVPAALAARIARVPIVIGSRRSLGHFKARKPHYLLVEKLANRMTDLIVANSEAVKQDVVRQEKVEPSKVRVIYNGIDHSLYNVPADAALKASLGIPKKARIVGTVANLIHYKGHRFFLQACQEIKWKHSAVKFLLIGDGPCRGELEGLTRQLGLDKEVLFLGRRMDIPQLLALMDLVVHPSLEEGLSNAVLEAMAAGKPVVASAVGGNPEVVLHGETGLLVPPGDSQALARAMLWVLEHPVEAAGYGEAGRRRVGERFGLSAMVRQYEAVYERLAAEKCPVRAQGGSPKGDDCPMSQHPT